MSAILKITTRPLRRPAYVSNAAALRTQAEWIATNLAALTDWFEQLRQFDPEDFCEFAAFCGVQFDREVELREKYRTDAREARYEYSGFDRDTGIAKHGEI